MREKGQNEVAKTLETPVFSRGREILTEKLEFEGPFGGRLAIVFRHGSSYDSGFLFYLNGEQV